jgi:dipeptidyl aminopeptidase/acylaminoacyl peptidase
MTDVTGRDSVRRSNPRPIRGVLVMVPLRDLSLSFAAVAIMGVASARGEGTITRPEVSESACPIEVVSVAVPGAPATVAVVRKPPGDGPFPALVHLHGGLETWPLNRLKDDATRSPTLSRFLAAGYVVVAPTFRARSQDPQTTDALIDCLAVVEYVKSLPQVDPKSVVVWGDSGGGSLALEIAGRTSVCAVAAQEPATVLFTGMYTKESLGGKPPFTSSSGSGRAIMADPKSYYTPALRQFTREKIARIGCPVFIARGNRSAINMINDEIVIPELKDAGKTVDVVLYPNEPHGFSKGVGTPEAALKFFNDTDAFFRRHLPTKPVPLDPALVKSVAVPPKRGR